MRSNSTPETIETASEEKNKTEMDGVVAAARGGSAGRLREWVDKGGSIDGHLDEVRVCLAAHSPVRAWLLRHPAAAVVIRIDSQACARWTPLHFAAADGHIVACKSLLGVGADANSVVVRRPTAAA